MMNIFHLAIPTHNISTAKKFYAESLGADIGREYPGYVIFNFYGHQVVCHHNSDEIEQTPSMYPRHFGIIFEDQNSFEIAYNKAKENNLNFFEDKFERLIDKPGWHLSFFLSDPSNNLVEFKYYKSKDSIFGK